MKQFLMAVILLIAVTGCEQNDIMSDLDDEYLKQPDKEISLIEDREQIAEVLTKYNFKASPDNKSKGSWVLHLYVDEKGKVKQIRNLTPVDAPLPNKTVEAVKELIAAPAEKNGKPVKSQAILTLFPIGNETMDAELAAWIKKGGFKYEKVPNSGSEQLPAWLASVSSPGSLVNQFFMRQSSNSGPGISGEDTYFVAVEKMPEPIGGIAAIQKHITYPAEAKRAGIEGRVYIKAYIDTTGNVAMAEVLRGIGSGCDEAALEAVKKTIFKPGEQRGKKVNVQVSIPIVFKLQ